MEEDRFHHGGTLYIVCMIAMLLSLVLFSTCIYILPYFIWGWFYDLPSFIFSWIEYLKSNSNYTDRGAKMVIFLSFFLPAVISGLVCFFTSNKIENAIYRLKEGYASREINRMNYQGDNELKETVSFSLQVIIMIFVVIAAVLFVEWLIAPTKGLYDFL